MKSRWLFLLLLVCAKCPAADVVQIDPAIRYQSIQAWGAPAGLMFNPEMLMDPLLDELVFTLGLTRLRFEPPRREWEDAINDDADPAHVSDGAFRKTGIDDRIAATFKPFKQRVESKGEHFEFYVSPSFFDGGSSGSAPGWLLNSPGEYAEWSMTFLEYLRSKHGLLADYYSICNEAGNNNAFTAATVAAMAKALSPRLEAAGFKTRIQFPECVSADTSWNYIQSTQGDAELWASVGLVSYHLYGGNSSRAQIRAFAAARGLPTGQTEYMGLTLDHLYDDLTLGGVSVWEYYALDDILPLNSTRTWFSRKAAFWQTRQVLHFVRPGAVRIGASSSVTGLRLLAFEQQGGTTLVLINTSSGASARTVEIAGLPEGSYARCETVAGAAAREAGPLTASNLLTVGVPANSVVTIYPHAQEDLPPAITDWSASPSYLAQPASSVTLSAAAADPELEPVAFLWSLLSAPAGAAVVFGTPSNATCRVTGLTAPGAYVFQVSAMDKTNTVTRALPVQVLAGNQAPELFDLHNRLPTSVMLPVNSTTLRCAGRDLEKDPLTFSWSIQAQPPGANVLLLTPGQSACIATNLSVPGEYRFRIELRDPTHVVSDELVVRVQPANRPPLITSATANPASLTLPFASTTLSALTSDPDEDPLSHWWSVVSTPPGALPVFLSPGARTTAVQGLIIPGAYTFKLTVVDRAGAATRNVTMNVLGGIPAPILFVASPKGGETWTSGQKVRIRWSTFQAGPFVRLYLYSGNGWVTIFESTPNDGSETWTIPQGNFVNCKLRISDTADPNVKADSEIFSIRAAAPRFLNLKKASGAAELEFEQEPGFRHTLQRSTNLASTAWESLRSISNAAQIFRLEDPAATNFPAAFYRIQAE